VHAVEGAKVAVEAASAAIESMRAEMNATSEKELHTRMLLRCAIYDLELRYKRLVRLMAALAPSPSSMLPLRLEEFFASQDMFMQAARRHRRDIAAAQGIGHDGQAHGGHAAYGDTAPWNATQPGK
jgi:hypothetical protein